MGTVDVRVSDDFLGRLLEEEAALATENEQLRARIAELEQLVKRHVKVEQQMQQENERLRKEQDAAIAQASEWKMQLKEAETENKRLRAALNRAGHRLAQVQPGVTEPWAYDIVPKAEAEIAKALGVALEGTPAE